MCDKTGYDENVDYKKMYLTLMNAVEQAMKTLIEAQRKCEELYISFDDKKKDQLS